MNEIDRYSEFPTPVGPVFVAYNDQGVAALAQAAAPEAFQRAFQNRFGRPAAEAAPPAWLAEALRRQLAAMAGDPAMDSGGAVSAVTVPFDLRGLSDFEQAVLRKAQDIPWGEVRTYRWLAREIGPPAAVRAAGSALGRNPVPLLIPCHRVVRTDHRIGGYVFGTEAKRAMLAAEGLDPEALERLGQAGVRYLAGEAARVYCFPTCRAAGRGDGEPRSAFRSAAAAAAAGYQPCPVCRPA